MAIYREMRTTIIFLLLLIIATLISSGECAPTLTKSLAPIWLPDDPINNNQHEISGTWNTKSSNTTSNTDIKSDAPIIRHISSLPMKKEPNYEREWGGGSLPFSILYVNTQPYSRMMANLNKSRNAKRPVETITTTTKQPSTRPTMRSRGGRQSRTQYSIIPELFMSYGWSGWGK